jgi:hypothetical protein
MPTKITRQQRTSIARQWTCFPWSPHQGYITVRDSGSISSGVVDQCSVVRSRECSVEDSDL